MRLPIQYALTYPNRQDLDTQRIDFASLSRLDFLAPDTDKFPSIAIAYDAIEKGGNIPCAMNAANEAAVQAFLENKIRFPQIPIIINKVTNSIQHIQDPSLEDIYQTNNTAFEMALKMTTN
jgi:1-deoxy-D-xylulose-5-phosphate reductoisomerase